MTTQLVIYWILLIPKKNDKLIPVDLSKKTKLKDPQQVNFIGKLERQKNGSKCFSSLKNQKKLL